MILLSLIEAIDHVIVGIRVLNAPLIISLRKSKLKKGLSSKEAKFELEGCYQREGINKKD